MPRPQTTLKEPYGSFVRVSAHPGRVKQSLGLSLPPGRPMPGADLGALGPDLIETPGQVEEGIHFGIFLVLGLVKTFGLRPGDLAFRQSIVCTRRYEA
jgi:hypothetical protein